MEAETISSPTILGLPTGWRIARLGSFCTKIGTGATPRGGQEVYLNRRVSHALIRSQHVFDRYFDTCGLRSAEVQSGELLNITGDGVTFGRACLVPDSILPACVNQHVSILRTDRAQCLPGYFLSFLTHSATKGYIDSFNAGGSRRAITKGHIESFLNQSRTLATLRDALLPNLLSGELSLAQTSRKMEPA